MTYEELLPCSRTSLEEVFCRPVGVELELQLVDASTLALQDGIDAIFAELPAELSSSVEARVPCVLRGGRHGCLRKCG